MSKRKTQEEFEKEVSEKSNSNVEVRGKYINNKTHIELYCKIHDFNWISLPETILRSGKCPKCSKKYRYTQEEFEQEIYKLNPNIKVLGKYINGNTKVLFQCLIDGYIFESTPGHMLSRGATCPKCSKKVKRTTESFKKEVEKANPNINILGDYVNVDTPILAQCKIDGYMWSPIPYHILNGGGCPKCANKWRRTTDEYKKEIYELYGDEYKVLGEYKTALEPIKMIHTTCKRIFYATPTAMRRNDYPCPYCEHPTTGEQRIINYLDSFMKNQYTYQKYYDDLFGIGGGLLSYDFHLPTYNLLIEYQGEFHDGTARQQTEEEFEIQKEHDKRKREYAKSHGIDLLEIWYWDFDNIEDILYNYLRNKDIKIS